MAGRPICHGTVYWYPKAGAVIKIPVDTKGYFEFYATQGTIGTLVIVAQGFKYDKKITIPTIDEYSIEYTEIVPNDRWHWPKVLVRPQI